MGFLFVGIMIVVVGHAIEKQLAEIAKEIRNLKVEKSGNEGIYLSFNKQ